MAAIYQSMGDTDQSLEFLKKSIQKDKHFKILAQNDSDFEALREDKKFMILTKLAWKKAYLLLSLLLEREPDLSRIR